MKYQRHSPLSLARMMAKASQDINLVEAHGDSHLNFQHRDISQESAEFRSRPFASSSASSRGILDRSAADEHSTGHIVGDVENSKLHGDGLSEARSIGPLSDWVR